MFSVFLGGRGAYAKFKDLLEYKGLLQNWYDFENQREEQALLQWCIDEEIELTDRLMKTTGGLQLQQQLPLIHSDGQKYGDANAKAPMRANHSVSAGGSSMDRMLQLSEKDWSKQEKEIARKAYRAAYNREIMAIAENVRKMAAEINEPSELWKIHDYLTEKRKETDEKYDYRYSVLILVFSRLMYEGWVRLEDLEGLSDEKLQKIRGIAEFAGRS